MVLITILNTNLLELPLMRVAVIYNKKEDAEGVINIFGMHLTYVALSVSTIDGIGPVTGNVGHGMNMLYETA